MGCALSHPQCVLDRPPPRRLTPRSGRGGVSIAGRSAWRSASPDTPGPGAYDAPQPKPKAPPPSPDLIPLFYACRPQLSSLEGGFSLMHYGAKSDP